MLRVICCNRIGLLPQRGQVVFHENETAGRTQLPTPLQAGISASPARAGLVHYFVTILLKNAFYPLHGLFFRRMNAVQLVLFAHRYPFVFTQLMVGQQLDFSTLPISRVNSPVRCAESSSSDQPGTTT